MFTSPVRSLAAAALAGLAALAVSIPARAQDVSTFTGYLDDGNTAESYTIDLNAGEAVLVTMQATTGDLDTFIELYLGDTLVSANDDRILGELTDSAVGWLAENGGTFTVVATRYPEASTSGDYRLQIEIGDPSILDRISELIPRETLSGPVETFETEHFVIHFTRSGDDAVTDSYVNAVAQTAEEMYRIEIGELGWPPPPSDGALGGDGRYDIYLIDLIGAGEQAFGITSPETVLGDNPQTPGIIETSATTSYFTMDNDFDDADGDPISLMRATLAHEFHHAIQFGFDANESAFWLFEATATWMETVAAGKDEDATGYVERAYQYPELCLGYVSDEETQLQYGQWTFMYHLTDLFGPTVVREVWDAVRTLDSFTAMGSVLERYGATVPDVAARYRLRDLVRDYTLAERFGVTVWLENTVTAPGTFTYTGQGVQELGANYFALDLEPGAYGVKLASDGGRLDLWMVGVRGDQADAFALESGGTFDLTPYSTAYLMVFNPLYDDDVSECRYADYDVQLSAVDSADMPAPTLQLDAVFYEPLK
jgi:hypothetical protein